MKLNEKEMEEFRGRVKEAAKKVVAEGVFQDWQHWYLQEFETEIAICTEEDLKECSLAEIEDSQSDFICSILNTYATQTCNYLEFPTVTGADPLLDRLLEEIVEIVKEELRLQFTVDINNPVKTEEMQSPDYKTLLYNSILGYYDDNIISYHGLDDSDFIERACEVIGMTEEHYRELMLS